MRTFHAGAGRVQQLRYSSDGKHLVVDLRGNPTQHPYMGFEFQPAHELVWWDWVNGQPTRRFRLRDSLYGPGGACRSEGEDEERGDWQPDGPAFDVSFCLEPLRVATAWEWTNKEDGNCVFDPDAVKCAYLSCPYKTHTMRIALAPDARSLAAATVNDMDGSSLIEHWPLDRARRQDEQAEPASPWHARRAERTRAEREGSVALSVRPDAFVFDGRFVAAGSRHDANAQCWDTEAPVDPALAALREDDPDFEYGPIREAETLEPGFAPWALALGPGHLLAIGGTGLALWNPLRREMNNLVGTGGSFVALAFDANGEHLATATTDGNLELWHVASKTRVRSFACGIGAISSVAFSPDGLTCAAGGENGQVVVWDVDA